MKKLAKSALFVFLLALALCVTSIPLSSCSSKEKIYLFSYGDYISPDVYDLFEEEYGIKVVVDEYAAPEDMYSKFTLGTAKYDLVCTTDYMLEKLIGEGYFAEINYENVPNFSNIGDDQKNAQKSFDPALKYTVPHFFGTVGLLYNTEKVKAEDVKSWGVLFDGTYAGKIIMPDSERDAMLTALLYLGFDPNTTDKAQLAEAAAILKDQKKDVQAYLLDEAARVKIESENADIAVIYNGEAYLAFESNDKLAFTVPEEGTCLWMDAYAIPKDSENKDKAELFLNFLCRDDVAKMNFEYIYYSTPNKAVTASLDAELLAETAIFPEKAVYEKASVFKYLGREIEEYYAKLWKEIKSS